MHRQGDHALNGGQIQLDAAVVVGYIGRFQLFVGLRAVVLLEVLFRNIVCLPDGGPAGGLGGHDIDAVAVVGGKIGNAGADKLHDLVLHIAVGVGGGHQRQRDIVGADAGVGFAGQIDGDHAGVGHVVGTAHQLFSQLAAALADGHGAQRTVAGVGVRAEDHPPAAGHHFPVVAVDDGHIRRDIDAAVLVRGGEGKLVVVLVDGAAHGAEAVVTVGQSVGDRECLHTGGPGLLDDAHIGDVVGDQRIKADLQLIGGAGGVVGLKDAVGHGFLPSLLRGDRGAGTGDAGAQEHAFIVDCDHSFDLLDAVFAAGDKLSIMIPYLNGFEKRFCKKRYIGLQILEKLQGNNVNLNDSCMMSGFCNRKIEEGSAGNDECRPLQAVWKGERVKKETD